MCWVSWSLASLFENNTNSLLIFLEDAQTESIFELVSLVDTDVNLLAFHNMNKADGEVGAF